MDLAARLLSADYRRAFEREMAGLIRSMAFSEVERTIIEGLKSHPSPFSAACLETPADQVRITGWEELFADIAAAEGRGKQCTAIGIDLSGHGEGEEPAFEVSLYDDGRFPFSTAGRADILAHNEHYGTPWQGCFVDTSESLQCDGLRQVFQAVSSYEYRFWSHGAELPQYYVGFTLTVWFIYLRVNQAIKRDLETIGLPRPMPVVVGEHDFGPWYETVYMVDRVADHAASIARITAARTEKSKADFDAITHQRVAELVETRSILRHWRSWLRPAKRKQAIDLAEAHERLLLAEMQPTLAKPTWRMDGKEFADVVEQFRRWGSPEESISLLPRVPQEARTPLHETFVTYGIKFGGRWVRMNVLYDRELLRDGEHPLQTGGRVW